MVEDIRTEQRDIRKTQEVMDKEKLNNVRNKRAHTVEHDVTANRGLLPNQKYDVFTDSPQFSN